MILFKAIFAVVLVVSVAEARFLVKRASGCTSTCAANQSCTLVAGTTNLYTCSNNTATSTTAASVTSVTGSTSSPCGTSCKSGQTCTLVSGTTNLFTCANSTSSTTASAISTAASSLCGGTCQNG
jgi:hypothetical protein